MGRGMQRVKSQQPNPAQTRARTAGLGPVGIQAQTDDSQTSQIVANGDGVADAKNILIHQWAVTCVIWIKKRNEERKRTSIGRSRFRAR
jgi:hypothetical protein